MEPWQSRAAFVVQFRGDTDVAAGRIEGKIEHISSYEAARFHSVEELLAFVGRILAMLRQEPWSRLVEDDGAMELLVGGPPDANCDVEMPEEPVVVFTSESGVTEDEAEADSTTVTTTSAIPSLKLRQNVQWIERETIRRALEVSPLKRQAAELMGISPRALSHYLTKYPQIGRDHAVRRSD